jgi:hypothetical protein
MQTLLLMKKDPFEPEVKFEDFVSEEKRPLKKALSKLFETPMIEELVQEEREMKIEISQEEKKKRIKIERKKRKKTIQKRGNSYRIREKLERYIVTLVYSIKGTTQLLEKPGIEKVMKVEPLPMMTNRSRQIIDSTLREEVFPLTTDHKTNLFSQFFFIPREVQTETNGIIPNADVNVPFNELAETKPPKYDSYREKFNPLTDSIKIPYELRESVLYENPLKSLVERLTLTQAYEKGEQEGQLVVYHTILLPRARAGETVLGLLKRSGHTFDYSIHRKYGILIEAVDGMKNGDNGAYIQFYVNGVLSPVGVSEYVLKDGDIVEFRLEKGGPCQTS